MAEPLDLTISATLTPSLTCRQAVFRPVHPKSSPAARGNGARCQIAAGPTLLHFSLFDNSFIAPAELAALRTCVTRERPWGGPQWVARTAARLGLEASLRPRGRPSKTRMAGKTRIKRKK